MLSLPRRRNCGRSAAARADEAANNRRCDTAPAAPSAPPPIGEADVRLLGELPSRGAAGPVTPIPAAESVDDASSAGAQPLAASSGDDAVIDVPSPQRMRAMLHAYRAMSDSELGTRAASARL